MEGDESQGGPLSSRTQPEATEPMHYVFDVAEDYPDWGLRRGDVVTVTFGGDAAPVELRRELPPNFGGVLALLEGGVLRCREDRLSISLRPAGDRGADTPDAASRERTPPRSSRVLRFPQRWAAR